MNSNTKSKSKLIDVYLYDPYPSSIVVHMTVRETLWNTVERISVTASDGVYGSSLADNELYWESEELTIDESSGLPLSFGSSGMHKYTGDKTKTKKTNKKKRTFDSVERVTRFSETRSEHNMFMAFNQGDGMYYPCRVVGVGSASTPTEQYAVVNFLGYGTYAQVKRSTELLDVPQDRHEEVQQLVVYDTLSRTSGYGPHSKYYDQRFRLFSKYDEGIQLDEESWFSVTPEAIAVDIAKKIKLCLSDDETRSITVLDCFCGVGGNTVAIAQVVDLVWAVDIDKQKIDMMINNARVYGASSKIEALHADAYQVLAGLARQGTLVNVILLAPPWGGIDYTSSKHFDIDTMITSGCGSELVALAAEVCDHIVFIVPKHTPIKKLHDIAASIGLPCRIEKMHLYDKPKMTVAYYGKKFQNIIAEEISD